MRKLLALFVVAAAFFALLNTPVTGEDTAAKPRLVLCSFWAEQVFALNLTQGIPSLRVDIIIPPTGSPHGFEMTPQILKKVADADLIVVNGILEEFLPKMAEAYPNKKIVRTTDAVKLIPTHHKEGEEHEEPGEEHEDEHGHHGEFNAHTWISVANAIRESMVIRDALLQLSPADAPAIHKNAANFFARLHRLAADMYSASASFSSRRIVTVHAAYDYLAQDLGLEVVSVVMKVPGSEPSPKEIGDLIRQLKETGAAIFAEPQFPDRIAKLLAEQAGMKVHVLDPGVTTPATADAYEKVMRRNLTSLVEGLK